MKRLLIIFRHSIAEDQNEAISDFERPLTKEGRELAIEKGLILKDEIKQIDSVISSPALRTKETAEIVAELFKFNKNRIIYDQGLYQARSVEEVSDVLLLSLDDQVQTALYCGHNPLISYLASELAGNYLSLSKGGFVIFEQSTKDWPSFFQLKKIKPLLISNRI